MESLKLIEARKKKRLYNFLIDLFTIVLLMIVIMWMGDLTGLTNVANVLFVFLLLGGYYFFMEYFLGKTIGKFFTKTKVVTTDGNKLTVSAALIRTLCRRIPFNTISLALGADAKAWHDVLSKTKVIIDD